MSNVLSKVGNKMFGWAGSWVSKPAFGHNPAPTDAPQAPDAPPAPAGVPTTPDAQAAAANVDADEQARQDQKLKRKGRAASILTGERGAGTPTTASKALTGE